MNTAYLIKKQTRGLCWTREEIVCVTTEPKIASEIINRLKKNIHLKSGEFGVDYILDVKNLVSGVGQIPEAIMNWI